jgi:hypothetical protein
VISAVTIAADPAAIERVSMNVLVVVAKAESTVQRFGIERNIALGKELLRPPPDRCELGGARRPEYARLLPWYQ